jgi:hypothetical protein
VLAHREFIVYTGSALARGAEGLAHSLTQARAINKQPHTHVAKFSPFEPLEEALTPWQRWPPGLRLASAAWPPPGQRRHRRLHSQG